VSRLLYVIGAKARQAALIPAVWVVSHAVSVKSADSIPTSGSRRRGSVFIMLHLLQSLACLSDASQPLIPDPPTNHGGKTKD
tara:strand:- start:588 stop:833 length:246 start_codon:yes stop_codon:yes gene_type:complete